MHRFWDIGLNRYQRSKLDLSDLENNLYNQSTPLTLKNSTRITSEKLYEAIHLGSTSILLINRGVKISQTWPFWPWQWPLEWFNQILLFTVRCHHPGEAPCQNKENVSKQILNKWTINVTRGLSAWQLRCLIIHWVWYIAQWTPNDLDLTFQCHPRSNVMM